MRFIVLKLKPPKSPEGDFENCRCILKFFNHCCFLKPLPLGERLERGF